ncbi:IS110 family transposase, partial [Sinorhizobium meliloti]
MTGEHVAFIGLDTSKFKISVAVAEGLSGILCGGPVSSVEEPLAKDDGELCLCLDPF